MPKYKLTNGEVIDVKEENVESFLSEDYAEGTVLIDEPVKTEAVATDPAPVTAVEKTAGTELALENGSLASQDLDVVENIEEPTDPKNPKYVNYTRDGEEVTVFEEEYNDSVKNNPNALTFEAYAADLGVKIVEAPAAPVIRSKSREKYILDVFNYDSYKSPKEISGFDSGTRSYFFNNADKVQEVAEAINGINYLSEGDEDLENLDAFAAQNPNETIVVYAEGEDDSSYKDSYNNLKNIRTKLNKLITLKNSEKGATYNQVKEIESLKRTLESSYDEHMRKFKTARSNVEYITNKNLSKKRFDAKGKKVLDDLVSKSDGAKILEDYNYYGRIYLSEKEKEIADLYEKEKTVTGQELIAVQKKIDDLRGDTGGELYDPVTGDLYNLDTAPKELIESYDRSESLAANTELDQLKKLSLEKQTKLIGATEDLYNILSDEDYLSKKGGFGSAVKSYLPILKNIIDRKKLPANLSDLESFLNKSQMYGSLYSLSPELGDNFNKTLKDYLEVNRAIHTNTNVLTSEDKEYANEFLDSVINKFGFDVDTKREKQEVLKDNLLQAGFKEEDVNKLDKGNELNLGQRVLRFTPDLGEFVFEVGLTRGASGNSIARLGKWVQRFLNNSYKGNKYAQVASKAVIPAFVEGSEFAATTALTNLYKGKDESTLDSGLAGFSMGIGGKITRGLIGSVANKVVKSDKLMSKVYETSFARGIDQSKVIQGFYKNFTNSSGGAGAYISGNILLNPLEFDYNNIGETFLEETAKMFLLGKFQKTLMTGGKSIKKTYEDYSSDILRFSDLNITSYKASKALKVDTNIIKKPTENSNQEVSDAADKARLDTTKRKLKKEITEEQAQAEYSQIENAKKALDVQIGINQAKQSVKLATESGNLISTGKQYVIAKKILSGKFGNLNVDNINDLSNMSPESLLVNLGMEVSDKTINLGVAYIDEASRKAAILDGSPFYISYKTGSKESTGYNPYELKSTTPESKKQTLEFLFKQESVQREVDLLDQEIKRLNKTSNSDSYSSNVVQNLENKKSTLQFRLDKYNSPSTKQPFGGETYQELQSKLKGAAFNKLDKDYKKYIKETGNQGSLVKHLTTESYKKALKNAGQEFESSDAFFDPVKGVRHIDMEYSINNKITTGIVHESTHWLLKDVIKDKNGKITPKGVKMIDTLLDSLSNKERTLINEQLESRYKASGLSKKDYYEENLTIFVELVKEGKIRKDVSLSDSLKQLIPFLKRNAFKDAKIDIETGEGVLELLENYAKGEKTAIKAAEDFANNQKQTDRSEQKVSKSSRVSDIEGQIEALEDKYDDGLLDYDDYEQQLDNLESKLEKAKIAPVEEKVVSKPKTKEVKENTEEVIKKASDKVFKDTEVSDKNKGISKVNEDIANEMLELGANSISDIKDPAKRKAIIDKLGKNNLGAVTKLAKKAAAVGKDLPIDSKLKIGYDEFFSGFSEELSALIQTYKVKFDGKKVPFGAYMNKNLSLRYGQILDKALKGKVQNSQSLDAEAGSVGSVKEIAAEGSRDFDAYTSADKGLPSGELIDVTNFRNVKDRVEAVKDVINLEGVDVADLTYKKVVDDYAGVAGAEVIGLHDKNAEPEKGQDKNDFQKLAERIDGTRTLNYGKGVNGEAEVRAMQKLFIDYNDMVKFIKTIPEFNVAPFETTIDKQGRSIDLTADAKGYSVGTSNVLLKELYDIYIDPKSKSTDKATKSRSITSPSGRGKGKTSQVAKVYRLKDKFRGRVDRKTVKELQKTIGITEAGEAFIPMKGVNRTKFGTALQGLTKIYAANVANTVIRKNIVDKGITSDKKPTEKVLADIGGGKSSVMFSSRYEAKLPDSEKKRITDLQKNPNSTIVDIFKEVNKIPSEKFKRGLEERREYTSDIVNNIAIEQGVDKASIALNELKKIRPIMKYEYVKFGFVNAITELKENMKSLDTNSKEQLVKNFLYSISRSARTSNGKNMYYVSTNKKMFNEVVTKLLGKEHGFSLQQKTIKEKGKDKVVNVIKYKGKTLKGFLDITKLKTKGFYNEKGDGFGDLVIQEADQARKIALSKVDKLKYRLENEKDFTKEMFDTQLESYLSLISLDQRGLIRKMSKPNAQIQQGELKATDLYLEHKMSALEIYELLEDYANNKITREKVESTLEEEALVNIMPVVLESKIPNFKQKRSENPNYKNVEGYESPEYTKELKNWSNKIVDRNGNKVVDGVEVKFSSRLSDEFNKIIENKTGIKADDTISEVKARMLADSKRRFDIFIPPSAEDFVGLLYKTLGKGKVGDKQMNFYDRALLKPYARAMQAVTRDRLDLGRSFKNIKKEFNTTPKDLKKKVPESLFNKEQAVRIYIWDSIGKEVPGLDVKEVNELANYVADNKNLKEFAEQVMRLNPGSRYLSPKEGWETGNITTDLLETLNESRRAKHLERWQQNADAIFSKENLNKLEAAYGTSYRKALENILTRMKTGRNRTYGTDSQTAAWIDWVNGSVGTIMFFNTRSAILQTLSATNFINFGDNNVFAAGKAFANQKQYWSDFAKLMNSEYLLERRDSLKINVNEADIADAARKNGARGAINYLLKLGFTPTKFADSFAIASGGSTFYRNRLNALIKKGMDPVAAEKAAMRDFIETAEESQQSSRPDKISQEQAGPLGRLVLAFANTPAQYARIIKKAASDLKNGRGDAKTNISKIMYYGVLQNVIFNSLQQALFAVAFGDEEDEEVLDDKKLNIANGMLDSFVRGTGILGAVFTVVKNTGIKIYKETEKRNPKYGETVVFEALKIMPPVSSKASKVRSAGRTLSWNMDEIKEKGFDVTNPVVGAGASVTSALTNIPLDRVIKKVENLAAASDSNLEMYKRLALTLGWSKWELGIKDPKKKKKKNTKSGINKRSIRKPSIKRPKLK